MWGFVNNRILFTFRLALLGLLSGVSIHASAQESQAISPSLSARMAISPPRIELQLSESGQANGEFAIINVSDRPLAVELSIFNWTLDESNSTKIIPPTPQSLDQWLIVNPLKVDIPANSNQTIRYGIRPKVKPELGEHRAIIYIKELPDQTQPESQGVQFRLTYGLPIYANVGKVTRQANIQDSQLLFQDSDKIIFTLDISNPGLYYVRPSGLIGVWQQERYPGDEAADDYLFEALSSAQADFPNKPAIEKYILNKPVLPKHQRQQNTILLINELSAGSYTARVVANVADHKVRKSINFQR